jgi:nicotinamide mononucleotide (NMN) deamidase PncC
MFMAEQGLAKMREALGDESRDGVCVTTTGIAGPTGGTATKPVGLCFVGLAISGEPTRFEEVRGAGGLSRDQYKSLFAQKALELVRQFTRG